MRRFTQARYGLRVPPLAELPPSLEMALLDIDVRDCLPESEAPYAHDDVGRFALHDDGPPQRRFPSEATVVLFGSLASGHTVCARVAGFRYRLFLDCGPTTTALRGVLDALEDCLHRGFRLSSTAFSVRIVERSRVFGYVDNGRGERRRFSWIELMLPTAAHVAWFNKVLTNVAHLFKS